MKYNFSFWEREAFLDHIDFIVLGAGIVGLNAALELRKIHPAARIVVLERGTLPIGASTRNAGFACIGSISELLDDMNTLDPKEVKELLSMRYQGLLRLREKLGDEALQYEQHGGYEVFTNSDKELFEQCKAHLSIFNAMTRPITGLRETYAICRDTERFGLHGIKEIIINRAEGQLHPGTMMKQLIKLCQQNEIDILTGCEVEAIEQGTSIQLQLKTGAAIASSNLIVATNGFARQFFPQLPLKAVRNQILLTQPINDLKLRGCFHYDKGYVYFRNVGNRVLIGGARNLDHQRETTAELGTTPNIQEHLKQLLRSMVIPQYDFDIEQAWSGILGVGTVKQPIIQKLHPNITVAVRLGGMGVAIGTLIGERAAAVASGQEIAQSS